MKKNPKVIAAVIAIGVMIAACVVLVTYMVPTIKEVRREMSLTPTPLPPIPASVRATELAEVVMALTAQRYDSPSLVFRPASHVIVAADPGMDWTLDGEFAKGSQRIEIENLHSAVHIMVNK